MKILQNNSRFDVVEENTGYLPVDDHINAIQNLATDKLIMTEAGYFGNIIRMVILLWI